MVYELAPKGKGEIVPWGTARADLIEAITSVPMDMRGANYDPKTTEGTKAASMEDAIDKRFSAAPRYFWLRHQHKINDAAFFQAVEEWGKIFESYRPFNRER